MSERAPVEAAAMASFGSQDRLYPARPILAASIAVTRDGRALIARRARPPLPGVYSLPGGAVEVGETLREAALRELREETGLDAEILGFIDHVEPITREENRVRAHFVIAAFAARWTGGEPSVTEELDAYAWVDLRDIAAFPTTPELPRIVARALEIAAGRP